MIHEETWDAYYDRFDYFTPAGVRDGCHPRIVSGEDPTRAVVLVHGLTDSPFYLVEIARHLAEHHGYVAYLPLLHFHGLREPRGMEGVQVEEWKANVRFAIKTASERCDDVSIGGLSTGGALAFYMACTRPRVTGDLLLFSAALDLAGGPLGLRGEIMERLARSFLSRLIDDDAPLVTEDDPYRYSRMDIDGARELARLMKENDELLDDFDEKHPFPRRVFAAHSEADTTADIAGIRELESKSSPADFTPFYIPEATGVSHASLVLGEAIESPGGEEREARNVVFGDMMTALSTFVTAR